MDQNENEIDASTLKTMQDAVRKDMQEYWISLNPEPDDPAIILTWNWPGLQQFAVSANAAIGLPQPNVQIRNIGCITALELADDIVNHIRLTVHNRFRQLLPHADVIFAPNNVMQFGHLTANMSTFSSDPFVQAVVRLNAGHVKFGRLSILLDKQTLTNAIDYDLQPGAQFCPFSI